MSIKGAIAWGDVVTPLNQLSNRTGYRLADVLDDAVTAAYSMYVVEPLELRVKGRPEFGAELLGHLKTKYRQHPGAADLFVKFCLALMSYAAAVRYADAEVGGSGWDVVGRLYMEVGWRSDDAGQFFTPWNVCIAMAEMSDIKGDVRARLDKAPPEWKRWWSTQTMLALVSCSLEQGEMFHITQGFAFARNPPEGFEPIWISDPTCGSGRTLLAAAFHLEPWMVYGGLVRFVGVDIDPRCARMAAVNFALYGMRGRVRCEDALVPKEQSGWGALIHQDLEKELREGPSNTPKPAVLRRAQ